MLVAPSIDVGIELMKQMKEMKILFIAPLPPPIDGQSKASMEALSAILEKGWSVTVINSNRSRIKRTAFTEIWRVIDVISMLWKIVFTPKEVDYIYISLSESFLGNLKDLFTYIVLRKNLDSIVLHMLGGSGMRKILSGSGLISRVNSYFMKKMKGVIVEGERSVDIFHSNFNKDKIRVVPNFFEDYLHVTQREIEKKFENMESLNVLYLSNLLPGKGYVELLEGYALLPDDLKKNISLSFVGGFSSSENKQRFLRDVANVGGVEYIGEFIDGEDKRKLYLQSHIFCLPTYYPYEGQPISILEAYATGCVVVTTPHAGIPDIFIDGKNGFFVQPRSARDICRIFQKISQEKSHIKNIAIQNADEAFSNYRSIVYRQKILSIFDNSNL